MFDMLITGGTLVDGTGAPGYAADVGITGEKIAALGDLSKAAAGRVIDASGLIVAPGFIDTHTPLRGRPARQPAARVRPPAGHHHRVPRHRRNVVRAALARELPHLSAMAEGDSRRAARGSRHEQRRGFSRALPPQGRHQHRVPRAQRHAAS